MQQQQILKKQGSKVLQAEREGSASWKDTQKLDSLHVHADNQAAIGSLAHQQMPISRISIFENRDGNAIMQGTCFGTRDCFPIVDVWKCTHQDLHIPPFTATFRIRCFLHTLCIHSHVVRNPNFSPPSSLDLAYGPSARNRSQKPVPSAHITAQRRAHAKQRVSREGTFREIGERINVPSCQSSSAPPLQCKRCSALPVCYCLATLARLVVVDSAPHPLRPRSLARSAARRVILALSWRAPADAATAAACQYAGKLRWDQSFEASRCESAAIAQLRPLGSPSLCSPCLEPGQRVLVFAPSRPSCASPPFCLAHRRIAVAARREAVPAAAVFWQSCRTQERTRPRASAHREQLTPAGLLLPLPRAAPLAQRRTEGCSALVRCVRARPSVTNGPALRAKRALLKIFLGFCVPPSIPIPSPSHHGPTTTPCPSPHPHPITTTPCLSPHPHPITVLRTPLLIPIPIPIPIHIPVFFSSAARPSAPLAAKPSTCCSCCQFASPDAAPLPPPPTTITTATTIHQQAVAPQLACLSWFGHRLSIAPAKPPFSSSL
ncbi:hypothetical protein DFH27DRAFT_520534 [Peziza echinospora]|nr:hypothetical protein DFH27DRAFT_520534 [Peziza echinospora]